MKKLPFLVLSFLSLALSWSTEGIAQGGYDERIVLEALQYMRNELGPDMVADSGVVAEAMKRGLPDISSELAARQIRVANPRTKLQCHDGLQYFTGFEKYVGFGRPDVSGDIALIHVVWSYSPAGATRFITEVQKITLSRTRGKWTVQSAQTLPRDHAAKYANCY
jgi:hypothetical protein